MQGARVRAVMGRMTIKHEVHRPRCRPMQWPGFWFTSPFPTNTRAAYQPLVRLGRSRDAGGTPRWCRTPSPSQRPQPSDRERCKRTRAATSSHRSRTTTSPWVVQGCLVDHSPWSPSLLFFGQLLGLETRMVGARVSHVPALRGYVQGNPRRGSAASCRSIEEIALAAVKKRVIICKREGRKPGRFLPLLCSRND